MRFPSILRSSVAVALSLAAATLAAPAQALTTVPIEGANATIGGPSLYTVNFDFILPSDFIDAELHITGLFADDRAVLRLNGVDVDSAGIPLPGASAFDFGSGNIPYAFGPNGTHDVTVTTGFLSGLNSLRLWINDTGVGVPGALLNGPDGPSGPTSYVLGAVLTYDVSPSAPGGVPEPSAWALMILGFGGVGGMMRTRRREAAIA